MTPNGPESEHSTTEQDSTSPAFLRKRILELEDDLQCLQDAGFTLGADIRDALHNLRRQLRAAERKERQ